MPRPTKWRRVSFIPEVTYFKPVGIPLYALEEVNISVEEAEAVRLKDVESLEQEQCAEKMSISRSTFQRVMGTARRKIADALLNGKAIRIEGGNFELATRSFKCLEGHEWEVPFEKMIVTPPQFCPKCNTASIMPFWTPGLGWGGGGRGRGWGGGPAHREAWEGNKEG